MTETISLPGAFDCYTCGIPLTNGAFQCNDPTADIEECFKLYCHVCVNDHGAKYGHISRSSEMIDMVIQKTRFRCRNCGCNEVLRAEDFNAHSLECIYTPCLCPAPSCDTIGALSHLRTHFVRDHGWNTTELQYGREHVLEMPLSDGSHVFTIEDATEMFVLSVLNRVITLTCVALPNANEVFSLMIHVTPSPRPTNEPPVLLHQPLKEASYCGPMMRSIKYFNCCYVPPLVTRDMSIHITIGRC